MTGTAPLCLTVIDVARIQHYIFGSNNLRQITGASGLVHWATHDAVYEALRDQFGLAATNLTKPAETWRINDERQIEVHEALRAELIYSGGGNTVLLFRTREEAVDFAKAYSAAVLRKAPGLEVVLTHVDVQWTSEALAGKVAEALGRLADKKRARQYVSMPLLGLGVTAECQYTGLPAVAENHKSSSNPALQRVSAEVQAKHDFLPEADKRMRDAVGAHRRGYQFIYDFDDLGDKGESSYLAVVHMDGNGMGRRVQKVANPLRSPELNRRYIEEMRHFSAAIEESGRAALCSAVRRLVESVDENGSIGGAIRLRRDRLPFRPIIFGGDDTTFVCDGRLALNLTHYYLQEMEAQTLHDQDRLYARAGIAVVGSHYPFTRAYALAEELARSAKELIQQHRPPDAPYAPLSALDWHFAISGPLRSLEDIRRREYQDSRLVMRPLLLDDYAQVPAEWRTWPRFAHVRDRFSQPDGPWIEKRNKVKALRDALRRGGAAVRQFMAPYGADHDLPLIGPDTGSTRSGWVGEERCIWFDAIEALDFSVALEPAARGGEE